MSSGTDEHFVVLGAHTPQQASRIAHQLQTTWEQTAQWADRWSQAHRSPRFPARPWTVVMGDSRIHLRAGLPNAELPRGPTSEALVWILDQQPPTLLVAPSSVAEPEEKVLRELKRQTVIAFLSYLPNGRQIPLWVRVGLADYLVEPPSQTPWPSQMPSIEPLLKEVVWGQSAPEHREISPQMCHSARLWVRYLWEGRDAQYAPEFVEALGDPNPSERFQRVLQRIAAEAGSPRAWDPQFGQPLVRSVPDTLPLGEPEQQLVFLLKLAWRFPAESVRPVQPRILQHGQDRTVQFAWGSENSAPMDLASLQKRVLDPARPRWATLDWDGRVVFSDDAAWWQTWFQQVQEQCQVILKDGRVVFQWKHPEGGALEGWLEQDSSQPARPIAWVKRVRL